MREGTWITEKSENTELKKKIAPEEDEGGKYEEVYCSAMPNFANAVVQPFRFDLGQFYDAIFEYNCTGKSPFSNLTSSQKNAGGDALIALGAVTGGITVLFAGMTNSGGAMGAIGDFFSGPSGEKVNVSNGYLKGGRCYQTITTTTTKTRGGFGGLFGVVADTFAGKETSKNVREDLVKELQEQYIGKGYEIFDEKILPILDFAPSK